MNTSKWTLISAVGAGILSVLCCVGPIIPVMLGFGGASVFLGLHQFKPIFIGLGLLVLVWASWYAVRQHRKCCATQNWAKEIKLVTLIFGVGFLTYAVLLYGVVPVLSQASSRKINSEIQAIPANQAKTLESLSLKIEGMTCSGCAVGVQSFLSDIPGIVSAEADWKTGKATIQYKPQIISPEDIITLQLPEPYVVKPI